MVIINREKNIAGPTSALASPITFHLFSLVRGVCSICLWTFSIITIAPSTIAPIAMAIPPKDIMLALTPCIFIIINATRIAIGRVIITTNDDRRWNKNAKQTNTTTINSSSNFPERLSIALWIRSERSYTVIISTPSGRLLFNSSRRVLTPSMVCCAFSP